MKKFTSTDLGGAPINKNDLRDIFNSEIYDVIEGLLSSFDPDSEGLVISGCALSANGSNFDMTAGIVYLDGEFMRVSAVVNQSFPKYIIQSNPVSDVRTFADTTTHTIAITKGAEVNAVASGVDYLTISSLTSLDARRWKPEIQQLNPDRIYTKLVNIGDWDVNAGVTKSVNIGVDLDKVRSLKGVIRNDAGTSMVDFPRYDFSLTVNQDYIRIDSFGVTPQTITLRVQTGGTYNTSADYNATSYNRGWVIVEYVA